MVIHKDLIAFLKNEFNEKDRKKIKENYFNLINIFLYY